MATHVDLLIIGTGSGNAIPHELERMRIAIVERATFGGTCLNRGCIPSKMLVMPANRVREAQEAAHLGVVFEPPRIDWESIQMRMWGRIDTIAEAGEDYRRSLPNVSVFAGDARFVGDRTIRVTAADGSVAEVVGEQVVLAAGASAVVPDIPGLVGTPFHTSDTIMRAERVPRRLVVIGGGFIAAEMGHVFASLGSEVFVVHRGARLLRHEDREVSARFTDEFGRNVELHLCTEVVGVEHSANGFRLALAPAPGHDGPDCPTDVTGDALLVTTGRRPNGAELGVEASGVELDPDGYVVTDELLRTTAQGIWALGDVRNPRQLKHLANREAKVVFHNIAHPESPRALDERVVPHAVFSHPEVASVGDTEQEIQARGQAYRVGRCDYAGTAYGWSLDDRTSFAKVLVDADTGLLLGGHVIGPQAATLMQQLAQAMTFGLTAERVAREQIWAHPGLAEVLENALIDALDA